MSSTTTIRDHQGRVVAHLREEGDTTRVYDPTYHTLGYYLRTRDTTYNAGHRAIGRGNQLMRLVPVF
ncbi:hypothetical protein MKK67_19515 [Methylobacterium sp. J-072]|uniref:hypothetical protein n=1 Tax=Methylobacterium sp. J-072 TaxID=2836651 RepID=UPI001FB9543B|nr:hypothetical protein [Methylobacterium sp. J-072]MCJ2094666.1 hypothetical protein [Methylobacterium sp. J-072]